MSSFRRALACPRAVLQGDEMSIETDTTATEIASIKARLAALERQLGALFDERGTRPKEAYRES